MMTELKTVDHHPKKKHSKSSDVVKESQFTSDVEKLFDILSKVNQQRRKLEKKHRLQMTQEDFLFYEDQKGPRKARCLCLEEPLTLFDVRFRRRFDKKGDDQPSGLSHSGSGDATGARDPNVLDDQSLFLDIEDSCYQCSESSSVSFSGASQPSLQNQMNFSNLAQITERYQISNKAAATLANAILTDVGLISESQNVHN